MPNAEMQCCSGFKQKTTLVSFPGWLLFPGIGNNDVEKIVSQMIIIYLLMMKNIFLMCLLASGLICCAPARKYAPSYTPSSWQLHNAIVRMDSIWEDSYNNCRLDVQQQLISDDLEFYHDRGGVTTSKTKLIAALRDNICGKVRRELKPGSIEVYPIEGYGTVEFGYHRFATIGQKSRASYARFVHLWKNENDTFRITRVVSLH